MARNLDEGADTSSRMAGRWQHGACSIAAHRRRRNVTLLDLLNAVARYSRSDAEVIATVVYMVDQGHVRLFGTFKG